MMRKLMSLIVLFLFPALLFSQGGVEFVPFAGYMFGGSVKYVGGDKLQFDNGINYGLSLLVPIKELIELEVNYTRLDSQAKMKLVGIEQQPETSLGINYFQLGILSKFYQKDTKVTPFASFSLGTTWFAPTGDDFQDTWSFSMTAGLGVKIMFSQRLGLLFRGRLMMPTNFAGTNFYIGGNYYPSENSLIAPFQGDFTAGLIVRVGSK